MPDQFTKLEELQSKRDLRFYSIQNSNSRCDNDELHNCIEALCLQTHLRVGAMPP